MGDDPYDFDIAIPSGKAANGAAYGGGGRGSGWGGAHSSRASDSDAASSSDADASDVSLSSDSDGKGRRHKTNGRTTSGGGGGVGLRGAGPTATSAKGGGGGGGSTALDKAKSFLSKYSSKASAAATPAKSSGRSRQLEMSLDDEDFSLDSSGESSRKPTASRKPVSRQGKSSASEEEGDDGKSERSNEPHSDDDESTSIVAKSPFVEPTRILQASSRNSDSVNPRPEPTSVSTATASGSMPITMAWRPSSTVEKASVSADDDDEIESVASQSEGSSDNAGAQRAASASVRATITISAGTAVPVAASESGVYEDEDFEEGSTNHAPSPRPTVRVEAKAADMPSNEEDEEESHVHYSLDFMEDGDAPVMTDTPQYDPPTPRPPRDEDARSNASSSSDRNKDSYVEEDSDGDQADKREIDHDQAITRADIPSVETAKAANDESEEYDLDARFESESAVNTPTPAPREEPEPCVADRIGTLLHPTAASTARSSPIIVDRAQPSQASQPLTCDVRERPRPRVQIVREYEQERGSVGKKDASTQFTGNHASIQTDVTPHGMLTGTERRSLRELPASLANEQTIELPSDRYGLSYVSPPAMSSEARQAEPVSPPPPPPSPFTSYGLYDPLQLPTDVSMSIYKQQLLSLQQQIHQKKLETERLFRERMSTRYTSLRGTERFLTSNRPSRMPLWEALLRIDPSLDDAKAKEIARMASDGAV